MTHSLFLVASLLVLPIVAAAQGLDLSSMPASICGWPSVYSGGIYPPAITRQAQRLLGYTLDLANFVVDGVFTDETTDQINQFEAANGLASNGKLNIDSWPTLVDKVTPLTDNDTGIPVEALQDALTANGFPVGISGVFDDATVTMLSSFQKARGANQISGQVVDSQTWHLLTTQCNNSDVPGAPGHFWFDAGWPQGNLNVSTLKCFRDHGFEYMVQECWRESNFGSFWEACVDNVANAWAAGFRDVGVYLYPNRQADPFAQAAQLAGNLTSRNVRFGQVMLDVEGADWYDYSQEDNQAYVLGLREGLEASLPQEGWQLTVYSSRKWIDYFGTDFAAFGDTPLIYAHYDNVPSSYDWDFDPYGGWARAAGKQFFDG